MASGSFPEIFRVALLSIPQKTQASTIPAAPTDNPKAAMGFHDNRILASVMIPRAA
jgi:hypothetical protein